MQLCVDVKEILRAENKMNYRLYYSDSALRLGPSFSGKYSEVEAEAHQACPVTRNLTRESIAKESKRVEPK